MGASPGKAYGAMVACTRQRTLFVPGTANSLGTQMSVWLMPLWLAELEIVTKLLAHGPASCRFSQYHKPSNVTGDDGS